MISLERWLAEATAGLIPTARARVCREIRDHYEDAIEAYQSDGQTLDEARAAALCDLGTAGEMAASLRTIYPHPRAYLIAALACQVFTVMALMRLLVAPDVQPLFTFFLMLAQPPCLFLALRTLITLTAQRYRLQEPLSLVVQATVVWSIVFVIGGIFEGQLPAAFSIILGVTALAAIFAEAWGLLWFSRNLIQIENLSIRLKRELQILLVLTASALLGVMIMAGLSNWNFISLSLLENALLLLGAPGVVAYASLCALLSWIFISAVRRTPATPLT